MDKNSKRAHDQRLINNLNERLFAIEIAFRRQVLTGVELQGLAKAKLRIEARLAELYGTEKYGLVSN